MYQGREGRRPGQPHIEGSSGARHGKQGLLKNFVECLPCHRKDRVKRKAGWVSGMNPELRQT